MPILCKYKDILGEPKKGLHSYRFFNIAIIDVILTFILAFYIQKYILVDESYYVVLFLTFILGIFLHWIFCVNTTVNNFIGL